MEATDRVFDCDASGPQPSLGKSKRGHGAFQVGDSLPARMRVPDMCRAFGVTRRTIYNWLDEGKLDRFEILPRIGHRAWSGAKVRAYLDGRR